MTPNNPAGLSVLVDPAFNLWALLGGGTNGGPVLLNSAASAVTVSLTAPGSNSYYATIYWNPLTNAAGVVYGATGASPFPILPDDASFLPLACVLLTNGQSQVQANNIYDIRNFWRVAPVRYYNAGLGANTTLNCAGATSVLVDVTLTAAITFTLTNLQVGIPIYLIITGNFLFTLAATTPGGTSYTLQRKQSGSGVALQSGIIATAGAGLTYTFWGTTQYAATTPYLRGTY